MIKLFSFLKPYAFSVTAVLVFMFFQSMAQLYLPALLADIVNRGIVNGNSRYIFHIGGLMLLVAAGSAACTVLASYLSAKASAGFGKDLRSSVFSRAESYSLHEFDQIGTASLITRTTNDINQVQQVLLLILRLMISAPMMAVGGIIMAVSTDATLSLVFVAVLPLLAAAIFLIAGRSIPLFRTMQAKLDRLNLVLRENLTGIRVIRAFNRIDHEKKRFGQANYDLTGVAIRVNRQMAAMFPLMMLVMNFTTIAILWFGSIRVDYGDMQVGNMMAFIQYSMQIMFSLVMVSIMFVMIPRAQASAVRINEVLDTVPDIKDAVQIKSTGKQKGLVEFKNVTFRYPGAEKPAIDNISFQAGPDEVTAIIGGTGAGKSTLVNLIPRFYDVDRGRILIDGVDVRELSQQSLRAKIGFVPQKAVLFTGTIADNIRFGSEGAPAEAVRQAAATAQATEFITAMKDGFDSVIAQGGANVSGGQKQRLAIARALVRRPEIYIFDDTFSALDYKTDARLRAALKEETGNSTVIIIAQRVSTVINADRILVMDNGVIAGSGNHEELLATCGVYREIVASQLSGGE
ncbi:abc transporter [Lucifera butyrica]|uniref:Abc transporter n=1 Tax=Lucifera butyrica TaxID=1351585 RepID=A0A498R324_9FIRM|nr:ABC transporter ATP-binding protein [Lucifera butyrica]VBB05227.1 abc transporter [Lucifera butyrica]